MRMYSKHRERKHPAWQFWKAPAHWTKRSKKAWRTFQGMALMIVVLIAAVGFANYHLPGIWILSAIVIGSLFFVFVIGLLLRDDSVYRQDMAGSLKRFLTGTAISILLAIPYRLTWENILLGIIVFLLVNLISIPLFTYTSWLNEDDAQERLIPRDRDSSYGSDYFHPSDNSPKRAVNASGLVITSSQSGWLTICNNCMSLVGDEEEYCWRCREDLKPGDKLYVALPVQKPPRRPELTFEEMLQLYDVES
jgi:uncharacterized membrane protein YagU involved in acid resistance